MFFFSPTRSSFIATLAGACALALASVSLTSMEASGTQNQLRVSVADAGIDEYDLDDTIAIGVEDFDGRDLVSDNGEFNFSGAAGTFSGYGWIQDAGLYGGSGGNGRHATANHDTIVLTMPGTSNYEYIGFWWSAGNAPNDVELITGNGSVITFSVDAGEDNLQTYVGNCRANPGVTAYCGNPNFTGQVMDEPYAFVHLRYEPGFREVRFSGEGFEFDNVTVSMEMPNFGETETVLGGFEPYELSTAPVLISDPRASSLGFPGVSLSAAVGEQDAMLCFTQSDSEGDPINGAPAIEAIGSRAGVTRMATSELVAFSGSRDDVEDLSSSISLEAASPSQRFGVNSLYVRVAVTPDIGSGTDACSGGDATFTVIEVRPLSILHSNSVSVSID